MVNLKKWEYVIKSLKKLNAPERAIDLVETIQEQLEVYDLNRNTIAWKYMQIIVIAAYHIDLIVLYVQLILQALKDAVKNLLN